VFLWVSQEFIDFFSTSPHTRFVQTVMADFLGIFLLGFFFRSLDWVANAFLDISLICKFRGLLTQAGLGDKVPGDGEDMFPLGLLGVHLG